MVSLLVKKPGFQCFLYYYRIKQNEKLSAYTFVGVGKINTTWKEFQRKNNKNPTWVEAPRSFGSESKDLVPGKQ